MKKMKQLIFIILLLGLLCAFVVPPTWAEEQAMDSVVATYDIWLYSAEDKGFNSTLFPKGNTRHVYMNQLKGGLDGFYNATSGTTLNWTFVATSAGNDLSYRTDADMILRTKGAGAWAALKLRVPESGNFSLAFSTDKARNSGNVTVYMFPASDLAGEETAQKVESLKTASNCLGTQAMNGLTSVTFDAKAYTEGEYIFVYESDVTYTYLTELQLVESQEEIPETTTVETSTAQTTGETTTAPVENTAPTGADVYASYNFAVHENGYSNLFKGSKHELTDTCNCGCKKTIQEHLAGEYENLGWMYVDSSVGAEGMAYRADGNWGLRMRGSGDWMLLKLNIPVSGTYGLQFAGTMASSAKIEAYVLTQGDLENGGNQADFFVGTADAGKGSDVFGNYTFSVGEYYVILQLQGTSSQTIYLEELALVDPVEKEPEEPTLPAPTTAPTKPTESTPTVTPGEGEYTEGVFNLALYTQEVFRPMFMKDGILRNLTLDKNCYICKQPLAVCISNHYAANTINWKIEATTFSGSSTVRAQTDGGVQFYGDTDEKGNTIMVTGEDGTESVRQSVGNWVAFRVKVSATGMKTITINKTFAYGYSGDLYIISAPAQTMTKADISEAMTQENWAGTVECTSTMNAMEVGDYNFQTAGEYIFILKATKSKRLYLNTITLTDPVPDAPVPTQDKVIYDFDQVKNDPDLYKLGMTSKYNEDGSVRTRYVLENLYNEGKIFWKYEAMSSTANSSACNFRTGCLRFKDEVNFRDRENAWYAFRIQNPGTATYDIRLVSSGASMVCANIYLIPAKSEMTLTEAKIQASMTSENLLIQGAIIDSKGNFYLGEYTFGTEKEYVLVVEITKGTILYLEQIVADLDGKVADSTINQEKVYDGVVYDFDQADSLNGLYNKASVYVSDKLSELNSLWNSGKLNWKWETASEGLLDELNPSIPAQRYSRFYRAGGYRMYCSTGAWTAFRIKSPGSGTFTLSLNRALANTSGTLAVYILPADTEDIQSALDPNNRVGKAVMYNDGSASVVDEQHVYLGYWDFEAGKEYIVVFEAYTQSPYSTYCYLNFSQLIAQRGKISFTTEEPEKKVTSIIAAENPMTVADPTAGGLITEVGGHQYLIIPMEGGSTLVYDLDTDKPAHVFNSFMKRPEDVTVDADGIVWIVGQSKYLVRYDPVTGEATQTKNFTKVPGLTNENGSISIMAGADGMIYFGTYYGGLLVRYNPVTEEYTVLENVMGKAWDSMTVKIRGISQIGNYLYYLACNEVNDVLCKYNLETGKVEGVVDLTEQKGTLPYIAGIQVFGNGDLIYLATNTSTNNRAFGVDPNTMEVVDVDLPAMGVGEVSEIIDGKQYTFCTGYGMYYYDLATKTFGKVPGFNSSIGFKSERTQVTIDGKQYLLSFNKTADVNLYDMETYELVGGPGLYQYGNGASDLRGFINGPEGSNELYIGAFNNHVGIVYNTETNEITARYDTAGQTDSQLWYEGKLYMGCYSSTTLNEMYVAENEFIQRWRLDHAETGQKRVHSLAGGDGYVFAGTITDKMYVSGSVVVYDTRTGRWFYDREVAPNLVIPRVVYHDKLVYGATSVYGGYAVNGIDQSTVSAYIFVYDYENRQTIATLDPRDYISGLPKQISLIAAVEKDPVVEGRFWAVVSETMFCFTFDRETLSFDVQEVISFDKSTCYTGGGRSMNTRRILLDAETNSIYYSFDTNGGFQCIELVDWNAEVGKVKVAKNTCIMGEKPLHYLLSESGDLYYASSNDLMYLPRNITEEDWAIAGEVDNMIAALGEVTLESEAAVKSARSAYENLGLRYKSMIQNLQILQEAEAQLLECRIDTVDLEATDADSLSALQELMDSYNGMTVRHQRYVKNYALLKQAHTKATKLNDERLAAALQARINALGEKFPLTLEDEPEVLDIRAAFDAMTNSQRVLVDTALLEEAEVQIAALRVEYTKYVESLIQAIPEVITLDAEEAITAAREAADKLYMTERKLVSYSKLTSAEGKLRTLKNAQLKAAEVDAMISEIGIVTWGDKDRIAQAREAYDALNETALQFVTNGKKLVRAEFILKGLQTWMLPTFAVVFLGAAFCVVWFVPSLRNKVFQKKEGSKQ